MREGDLPVPPVTMTGEEVEIIMNIGKQGLRTRSM